MEIYEPTLVLHKQTCLQNIELMANKALRHNMKFRPHFKTHQSIEIARWFRNFDVKAITVSSVKMARYFASDGWNDITIAFPFNKYEVDSLNELLPTTTINIILDNYQVAEELDEKINSKVGVFIKISTGYFRSGINSGNKNRITKLVNTIVATKNLNFKGFLTHAGHTYNAGSKYEIRNIHFDSVKKMVELKNHFKEEYPNIEISVGDTPSCTVSEYFNDIDEIRPGNFVFYDLMQYKIGVCKLDNIAVRMFCPVVSRQKSRNEIVLYGGAIHFSKDWITNIDGKPMFGRILLNKGDHKELLDATNYISKLTQEHAIMRCTPSVFQQIEVGDILEVIPVHSCLTAHAMGRYISTKGEIIDMMPRF